MIIAKTWAVEANRAALRHNSTTMWRWPGTILCKSQSYISLPLKMAIKYKLFNFLEPQQLNLFCQLFTFITVSTLFRRLTFSSSKNLQTRLSLRSWFIVIKPIQLC
ncbi:hypothetical protein MHYP_G00118720 [Metynnis hypsauchen]